MTQSGARFVRTPFEWNAIEKAPGHYDWSRYDGVFAALKAAGMTPLPIVVNAPAGFGYTPGAAICGPLTPAGLDAFERFLTAAMERYGSRSPISATRGAVTYWQIHNEADFYLKHLDAPNGDLGALGGGCLGNTTNPYNPSEGETNWGPRQYVEILKRATNAKRAADPAAKIVFAALAADGCYDPARLDAHGRPAAVDDISRYAFNCRFFSQVLAAGGAPYFDLVSFNSYLFYRRNHETPTARGFLGKIERFRDALRDAAASSPHPELFHKPIVIAETGLAYGRDTRPCTVPNNSACVDFTPDTPALLVAPLLAQSLQAHTAPSRGINAPVDIFIWFALATDRPSEAGDWGLIYRGQPTQAYLAYQYGVRQLLGFVFAEDRGEATMVGGSRPIGGSEPCFGDATKSRRCNSLQWLVFTRPDGLQRHVLWVDSGYPHEPHAWRITPSNGGYVATPVEREVGFPIVPGEILTVTSDIGVVLTPHRQENGYAYFTVTHRAIYATVQPARAPVNERGGTVRYTPPPPPNTPKAPPPPPPFESFFPPGSVPAGATIFVQNHGRPSETPGNAPSLGSSFTLGCTTPSGQPCQLAHQTTITFDLRQFADRSVMRSLGLYQLTSAAGRSALAAERWVKVDTLACDAAALRCTAAITSFGTFAVLDERSSTFVPLAMERIRP